MGDWQLVKAEEFINFNPRESVPKGMMAKKVAMEQLQPFTRDLPSYEVSPFNGGSKFRNGDTLMARITPCLENGKTALVDILEDGEVGFGSTEFIVLRAKPGVSDRNFIYYLAISPILRDKAIKSMVGSSGRQRVQQGVMNDIKFFAPPLSEQIEIGRTLRALDDKIATNAKINHHLEQMAQAIFKSWFLDFEPWGGVIPSDWREVQLADVCDVKGGKRLPKGENLTTTPNSHPYIRVRDMNNALYVQMNDAIEYVNDEIQHSISRYIVAADDIIVSIVGTIGMVCKVHPSMNNANLTENCVKLTNLHEVTSDFLYLFLSSPDGQEAIRRGTVGAVQAKLPIKNIQAITIMCPPANVMTDFDCFVSQAMLMIANNCTENQRLATLRDTLLPRLMSGELSVANLESAK